MQKPYFQSIKKTPVSHQIADQIKSLILQGNLTSGEKLPSERELSSIIGVGRFSVREGFRILESIGILETKHGVNAGTYVSKIYFEDLVKNFSDILRLSNITIEQLTEARLEISLINLKYLINRATEENILELEKCLLKTQDLLQSGLRTRDMNIYFHQLIAQFSNNPIFIFLHSSLLEILKHFLSKFESFPEYSRKVFDGNRRIFKYIKARDFDNASKEMRRHLSLIERRLKKIQEKMD